MCQANKAFETSSLCCRQKLSSLNRLGYENVATQAFISCRHCEYSTSQPSLTGRLLNVFSANPTQNTEKLHDEPFHLFLLALLHDICFSDNLDIQVLSSLGGKKWQCLNKILTHYFHFFFVYAFVCIFSVATNISPVYWGAAPALRWAAASGWGALSGAGGA